MQHENNANFDDHRKNQLRKILGKQTKKHIMIHKNNSNKAYKQEKRRAKLRKTKQKRVKENQKIL